MNMIEMLKQYAEEDSNVSIYKSDLIVFDMSLNTNEDGYYSIRIISPENKKGPSTGYITRGSIDNVSVVVFDAQDSVSEVVNTLGDWVYWEGVMADQVMQMPKYVITPHSFLFEGKGIGTFLCNLSVLDPDLLLEFIEGYVGAMKDDNVISGTEYDHVIKTYTYEYIDELGMLKSQQDKVENYAKEVYQKRMEMASDIASVLDNVKVSDNRGEDTVSGNHILSPRCKCKPDTDYFPGGGKVLIHKELPEDCRKEESC